VIEGYKKLQPDSGDQTVALLQLLLQKNAGTNVSTIPDLADYIVPSSAVRYNCLWFLSLVLALSCALGATLVKQWARIYTQEIFSHTEVSNRADMRQYLFEGLMASNAESIVNGLPALLQISVVFFFFGPFRFPACQ